MDDKPSGTAKRDLVIQAGMQAIPYVGGSLVLFISAQNKSGGLRGSKASMLSWQRKCRGFQTKFPL